MYCFNQKVALNEQVLHIDTVFVNKIGVKIFKMNSALSNHWTFIGCTYVLINY